MRKLKYANVSIKKKKLEMSYSETNTQIRLPVDYTQVYHIIFKYIAMIENPISLKFIMWILHVANEDNGYFNLSDSMIAEFIEDCRLHSGAKVKPTVNEVRECMKELVEANVIIKGDNDKQFVLNPQVFWSDNRTKRARQAKAMGKLLLKPPEPKITKTITKYSSVLEDIKFPISRKDLVSILIDKMNVSQPTAYRFIDTMLNHALIKKQRINVKRNPIYLLLK